MKKGFKRTGVCFLITIIFWLAAILSNEYKQIRFEPEMAEKSFHRGLLELRDRDAAVEYLEDSLPKLRELIDRNLEYIPREIIDQAFSGSFNG